MRLDQIVPGTRGRCQLFLWLVPGTKIMDIFIPKAKKRSPLERDSTCFDIFDIIRQSKNVRCRKLSNIVEKCRNFLKNVEHRRKMLKFDEICQKMSKNVEILKILCAGV